MNIYVCMYHTSIYNLLSLSIIKEIISSQELHQNRKWFDAGIKKMSGPLFGTFIKLMNVTMYRVMGLAPGQNCR